MAIAKVQTLGSLATKTSGTTTVLSGLPASTGGNAIVVFWVGGVTVSSVTDSRGNSYTLDKNAQNGTAAKVYIAVALNMTALVSGDSITINHGSGAGRAAIAYEFSGLAGSPALDVTNAATGSSNSAAPGSVTPGSANEIVFTASGWNGPNTDSASGSPDAIQDKLGTTGGSSTSNRWLATAWEIQTTAGAVAEIFSNATQSTGWAALAATYKAGSPAGAALAGTATGVATVGAGLTTGIVLGGSSAGTAASAGTLSTGIKLAGSIAGSAGTSGALTTGIVLSASSAGIATAASALTTSIVLGGTSAGAATVTGSMGSPAAALAGSSTGSATAAAGLTTGIPLVGSAPGTAAVSAQITTAIRLAGTTVGAATAAGAVTTAILLAGASAGTATAASALGTSIRLLGSTAGSAATSADLTTAVVSVVGIVSIAAHRVHHVTVAASAPYSVSLTETSP